MGEQGAGDTTSTKSGGRKILYKAIERPSERKGLGMSIFKRGNVYWYKFMWNGEMVRESTRQGNDRKARTMESAHRTRLAAQEKEMDAARERLQCEDVLACHECEKFFNVSKALRKDGNVFCSVKCAGAWDKSRSMPTLKTFLEERFLSDAETRHKTKPSTYRYYKQSCDWMN